MLSGIIRGAFISDAYVLGKGADGKVWRDGSRAVKEFWNPGDPGYRGFGNIEPKYKALTEFYLGKFAEDNGVQIPKPINILAPDSFGRSLYPGDISRWAVVSNYIDGITLDKTPRGSDLRKKVVALWKEQLKCAKDLGIDIDIDDQTLDEGIYEETTGRVYVTDTSHWRIKPENYKKVV